MNVTEIRTLIRQAGDKAWYNSLEIKIEYPFANFEIEIKGLDSIYQFIKRQLEFFEKNEPLPQILQPSKVHFEECILKIESYVHRNLKSQIGNYTREWDALKNFLEKRFHNNNHFFNKESETTDFILKLDSEFKGAATGAYDFFTNNKYQVNNADKNYFIGWHRAYEFFTQDADLVRRRNNERQTLSRIRTQYIQNLEQNDKNVSEHIASIIDEYDAVEKKLDRLIRIKNENYKKWRTDSDTSFQELIEGSTKKLEDLESLYSEKLKLEAPAKYWKDRALKLRKEGDRWLYWLIGVSSVAVLLLGTVLFFISDGTLKELFEKTGSAIRWSIVFITFVSFLAYAIRTFAKLMFSAYHLHRDAEEREQLAYVYLALKKEQNIDDTERHLIMQSIFSRADSGLLRDDSSPTMPGGGMLDKIIGGGK